MPGSVATLRDLSSRFMEIAKKKILFFLVGHVTKEGAIAGPKALEHLVDVVLYLEGDANHPLRLLRSMKTVLVLLKKWEFWRCKRRAGRGKGSLSLFYGGE